MQFKNITPLRGNVVADAEVKTVNGKNLAEFRIAVNDSRRQDDGSYVVVGTEYYNVEWWHNKAENLAVSLKKGNPVIVGGDVKVSPYMTRDGQAAAGVTIRADFVAPDFTRCTVQIIPNRAQQRDQHVAPSIEQGLSDPGWGHGAQHWATEPLQR